MHNIQNNKDNVYVDLGNSCTKFGYYQNNEFKVVSINNYQLDKVSIETLLIENNLLNPKFYISSVNEDTKLKLSQILDNLKCWYYYFNHCDLVKFECLFKQPIQFNQIGLDLLFCCHYLSEQNNCLILIMGTVFVFIKKNDNLIQGFLFLPNLLKTYQQLLAQIHLNDVDLNSCLSLKHSLSFGTNNDECFNNSMSLLFSNFINGIIQSEYSSFNKIIISGGASEFFKDKYLNIHQCNCEYIDNLCILGIKKFIENQ